MKRQTRFRRKRRAAGTSLGTIFIVSLLVVTAVLYYQLVSTVAGDAFSTGASYGNQPVKSFTLVAEDFGYNGTAGGPTLVVNTGDLVEITLIGKSQVSHNLKIDEFSFMLGGEFGVKSGESDTKVFAAEMSGSYKYYCRTSRLGGHESLDQFGVLIVQ